MLSGTAKISSKGQVTIPISIRREFGIEPGDSIFFYKDFDGRACFDRSDRYIRGMQALENAQRAFEGAAEAAGLETEQDVVDMINRMRRGEDF